MTLLPMCPLPGCSGWRYGIDPPMLTDDMSLEQMRAAIQAVGDDAVREILFHIAGHQVEYSEELQVQLKRWLDDYKAVITQWGLEFYDTVAFDTWVGRDQSRAAAARILGRPSGKPYV